VLQNATLSCRPIGTSIFGSVLYSRCLSSTTPAQTFLNAASVSFPCVQIENSGKPAAPRPISDHVSSPLLQNTPTRVSRIRYYCHLIHTRAKVREGKPLVEVSYVAPAPSAISFTKSFSSVPPSLDSWQRQPLHQ
jgi:hypothetical protein